MKKDTVVIFVIGIILVIAGVVGYLYYTETKLEACLQKADKDYKTFIENNSNSKEGSISKVNREVLDIAEKTKQTDIDNCIKIYK